MAGRARNNQTLAEAMVGTFATGFVCFWACFLVITTLLFGLKEPLSIIQLGAAGIVAAAILAWYTAKTTTYALWVWSISLAAVVLVVSAAVVLSGGVIDVSYDGQAYHQEAVIQLSRGWNPVYMQLNGQATANLERWLNHYPKGVWYFAAGMYALTQNIESGKALALVMPVAALAFCLWGMWRLQIGWPAKILVSVGLVFNPVVIYQSLSYYLDGVLVSLLLSGAAVGVRLATTRDRTALWPWLFIILILVNIKLSSLVFTIFLAGSVVMYLWLRDWIRLSLSALKFTMLGFILGVVIVGYNPFVTNFVLKGHPLYPTMGRNAIDYLKSNLPQSLWPYPAPIRLAVSLFSVSSLARGEGQAAQFKWPFTFVQGELETFFETNAKTGGFGPWFGGIFILSMIAAGCLVIFSFAVLRHKLLLVGVIGLLLGLAALVSTGSVARFVPFVWWIPAVVALFCFWEESDWVQVAGLVLVALMIANTAIVAWIYFPYNLAQSRQTTHQLEELAQSQSAEPMVIDVGLFGSTKVKLKQFGISYFEVPPGTECLKRERILVRNVAQECTLNESP